jgi:hypothetical protein
LANRKHEVLVTEPCSLPAQQELLELFLEHLPAHYPGVYTLRGTGSSAKVTVTPPGGARREYRVEDYQACPLELCSLLVTVSTSRGPIMCEPFDMATHCQWMLC